MVTTTTTTIAMAATTTSSSATASCTTAVPGKYGRVPIDACNAYYFFDPSFSANLAFAVLFGMTTMAHLVEAVIFKKVLQDLLVVFSGLMLIRLAEILLGHYHGRHLGMHCLCHQNPRCS